MARPVRWTWRTLHRFEREMLVGVAAWSLAALGVVLLRALLDGGTPTWVDTPGTADGFQYLAWVRDAGDHVLASNLYDVRPSGHVLLHPMWTPSGLLPAVGLDPAWALVLWKPVAVVALLAGSAAYVRRSLGGEGERQAALALALFFIAPLTTLTLVLGVGDTDLRFQAGHRLARELTSALYLWGYLPTAIALGLMPLFLLGAARIVERPERRTVLLTAVAGLLVAWLHPWQGATLLAIVGVLVVWSGRRARPAHLALPAVATVLPLAYFAVLSRSDRAWEVGRHQTDVCDVAGQLDCYPPVHWWVVALGLLPLVLPAALAVRDGARSAHERMLLLWPPAALLVYVVDPAYPFHALAGLALPLGILAVRGWPRLRLPAWAGTAAVLALTLPSIYFVGDLYADTREERALPFLLRGGEDRALDFLEGSDRPGAVLARGLYLGSVVPSRTGRATWVGHPTWTPAFTVRERDSVLLLDGRLPAPHARALVRDSGVAFVLADCAASPRLRTLLGPAVTRVRRFGCATVYETAQP